MLWLGPGLFDSSGEDQAYAFQMVKSFRMDPPTNSRKMELSGIRSNSKGRNHSRKASRRLASMYSGVPWGTWRRIGSASGLRAESSYTSAELNIASAFSW